jgi:hypothetical protein
VKLVDNWLEVLAKGWSMHLWGLSVALATVAQLAPMVDQLQDVIPAPLFAKLSILLGLAGMLARLIQQFVPAPAATEPPADLSAHYAALAGTLPPKGTCTQLWPGYWCSREAGHDGPCALRLNPPPA